MRWFLRSCIALTLAASFAGPSSAQWPTPWDVQSPIRQMAILNAPNQVLSGGATTISNCAMGPPQSNQSTAAQCTPAANSTVTVNPGLGATQYVNNNAAFNLAAPANDGSTMILVLNGASAGTITPTGFTVGSNTGASLTTTNTNKFTISVWRITIPGTGSTSGYNVFAHQ